MLGDHEADEGISELQARLNELQRSVELLGTQGVWAGRGRTEPGPPPEPATGNPYAPPIAPPPLPPPAPPIPAPYDPAAAAPVQPPIAPPSSSPGTREQANGNPAISDPEASVAMVDAGPFADLVELRHFEDDLSSLTAVHDVRVRRFGQSRAMIEVGMAGPYDLALELPRLGLPMDVSPVGPDELIIEFAPLPDYGPPEEPPASAGDGEEESG